MSKIRVHLRFVFICIFISVSFQLIVGCVSIPKADPVLVSQYKAPIDIGEQETLIFVIRQDIFRGSAQGLWVACNDRYIADLSAGSYTYFKTRADINTVNLRQMQVPIFFRSVDFRPGETVFFYLEYGKGFYEVDKDLGKTMVMQYNKIENANNPEKNVDYVIGLMNPGLVDLKLMKETAAVPEPDANHATVTFLRPQDLGAAFPIGIWNQDGFLGDIRGRSQFTVKLQPGEQFFIANSRFYNALKADLSAGKKYYIIVETSRGWSQMNISFLPVKADIEQNKIREWMNQSAKNTECTIPADSKIQKRIAAALPLVSRTIDDVKSGKLQAPSLAATDGR
jgi:hypothetical protein